MFEMMNLISSQNLPHVLYKALLNKTLTGEQNILSGKKSGFVDVAPESFI